MLNLKFASKKNIKKLDYFNELNIDLYDSVKIFGVFPYHTYRLYDTGVNSVNRKIFTDIENVLKIHNRIDNKYIIVLEIENYAGKFSYIGIYIHDDHARLGYKIDSYYRTSIKEIRKKKLKKINKLENGKN